MCRRKAKPGFCRLFGQVFGAARCVLRPRIEFAGFIEKWNSLSYEADILPGTYDLMIRPLECHLESLEGVDVFHGGISGPKVGTRRVRGVDPVILRNVRKKVGRSKEP